MLVVPFALWRSTNPVKEFLLIFYFFKEAYGTKVHYALVTCDGANNVLGDGDGLVGPGAAQSLILSDIEGETLRQDLLKHCFRLLCAKVSHDQEQPALICIHWYTRADLNL